MSSAIIFISGQIECEFASLMVNDKMLIDYTIDTLRRLDLDVIYLIGGDKLEIDNVVKRDSVDEIILEIKGKEGKCLLLSPFYPLIEKEDYLRLLEEDNSVFYSDSLIPAFCLNNADVSNFEQLEYKAVSLSEENTKCFKEIKDIPVFWEVIKKRIINKHLDNGVIILEPNSVSIGIDVSIDRGTYIDSDVSLYGKTSIGKSNHIGKGTIIKDSKIGDGNIIENSRIESSALGNKCEIGPCSIINFNSFVSDNTKISSYVSLSNCRLSNNCYVGHLSCLTNTTIRNNVRVGTSVTTANNKLIMLGSFCEIGNGVNLISPLYIGSYAFIAAGSTIDKNVENGDLAIARLYQQNKKGYGYRYTKEGQ